jgi:hypothetical protein
VRLDLKAPVVLRRIRTRAHPASGIYPNTANIAEKYRNQEEDRRIVKPGPKFPIPFDDNPDEMLEAAARLTLRLALRCDWVEGCEDTDHPHDPDSWDSLYERIRDLMGAYVHSREGKDEKPSNLLAR